MAPTLGRHGARAGESALAAGAAPLAPLTVAALTLLTGLITWAVTILQARASTTELFADLGVTIESIQQLQKAAAATVAALTPLLALLAVANAALMPELGFGDAAASARLRRAAAPWMLAANNAAIVACAFGLAAAFGWLVDMQLISQAAAGGGRPWPPPVGTSPAEAAIRGGAAGSRAAPAGVAAPPLASPAEGPLLSGGDAYVIPCPPGCLDVGAWAAILKLPWHCVCLPGFVAKQMAGAAHRAVRQLAFAVAGGTLMVVGASWLAMLAAAAYAAGRVAAAASFSGAASAADSDGLDSAREQLLPSSAAAVAHAGTV